MSKFVLADAHLTVNGVNLSNHVESITLNYESEAQDTTSMGDLTRIMAGGLKNWSLDVNFRQDLAAGLVDATLFPIVGSSIAVAIRNSTAAVSATNPSYNGTALVTSYQPIGGSVGEVANAPVKFVAAGTLTRVVS